MRKYLLGLFAIVMAVSLSAFSSAKSSKAVVKTAPLYWFLYDHPTSTVGSYLDYGEKATFITGTCNDVPGDDCRRGYPSGQLVNPAAPSQGVSNRDANDDQITKQ